MIQVTIDEAKTHLSHLIQQALDGEEIIIARDKQPLVKLSVLPEALQARRIGGAVHVIVRIAPDFDAPLNQFERYTP